MKTFKDNENNLYAFEEDGSQDHLIADGMTPVTEQEAEIIRQQAVSTVPYSVTRFQALAALHLGGFLEGVETLMADPSTNALARLAWRNAQEFRRDSPTILALANGIGLDVKELDDLFRLAATIDA